MYTSDTLRLDFGLELFLVIDRLLYGESSVGRICILTLITLQATQLFRLHQVTEDKPSFSSVLHFRR